MIDFDKLPWPKEAIVRRNLFRAAHLFSAEFFNEFGGITEAEVLRQIADFRNSLVPRSVSVKDLAHYQSGLPDGASIEVCDVDLVKLAQLVPLISFAVNKGYVLSGKVSVVTQALKEDTRGHGNFYALEMGATPMRRVMNPVDAMEYEASTNMANSAIRQLRYNVPAVRTGGSRYSETTMGLPYDAVLEALNALESSYQKQKRVVEKYVDGPPLRFHGFDVLFEPSIPPGLRSIFLDNLAAAAKAIEEFGAPFILYGAVLCSMTPEWTSVVQRGIKTYVPNDRYAALYNGYYDCVLVNMGRLSHLSPAVIVHELGHRLEIKALTADMRKAWIDAVTKEADAPDATGTKKRHVTVAPSTYGFTDYQESFAEFMGAYCWGVDGSGWDMKHTKGDDGEHSLESEEKADEVSVDVLRGLRSRSNTKTMPRNRFREFCGLEKDDKPPYWIPDRRPKPGQGRASTMTPALRQEYETILKGYQERYSPTAVRQMMAMAHAPNFSRIIGEAKAYITIPGDPLDALIASRKATLYVDLSSARDFEKAGLNLDFAISIRLGDSPTMRAAIGEHAAGGMTAYQDRHKGERKSHHVRHARSYTAGPMFVKRQTEDGEVVDIPETKDLSAIAFYAITGNLHLGVPLLSKALLDRELPKYDVIPDGAKAVVDSGRPLPAIEGLTANGKSSMYLYSVSMPAVSAIASMSAAHHGAEMPNLLVPGSEYTDFSIDRLRSPGSEIKLNSEHGSNVVVTADMIATSSAKVRSFMLLIDRILAKSTIAVCTTTLEYASEATGLLEALVCTMKAKYESENGQVNIGALIESEYSLYSEVVGDVVKHYRVIVKHGGLGTVFVGRPVKADDASLYRTE